MNKRNPWILLRGLGRSSAHWMDFTSKLQEKLPEDDVVALDLPGNGILWQQTSPETVSSMREYYQLALKKMGISPPYRLVSLSLGGMVALEWLHHHPDDIEQIFVINSSNGAFSRPLQRFSAGAIFPVLKGRLMGRPNLERAIFNLTCNLADPVSVTRHFIQLAKMHPVSPQNMVKQMRAAAQFDQSNLTQKEKVILICAEGDRLVSPSCSKSMSLNWGIPLRIHPSAGHDLPVDDPDWLVSTILQTRKGEGGRQYPRL